MNLAELVDDKTALFERPKTLKAIQQEGKLIEVTRFTDIVPALANRRSTEAVLIHTAKIIPDDFYSAANFSKRGPLVYLDTFAQKDGNALRADEEQLKKEEWSDLKARIRAEEEYRGKSNDGPYTGWAWVDPERQWHVVHPTTAIEGHRLLMWAIKSRDIRGKIEIKPYSAADSKVKTIKVKVPSRSEDKKHDITIEHVTGARDPERFIEWTRLRTRHECPHKRNDFTFRWPQMVTYCPHDVAAYAAYARKIAEETGQVIPQPFPLFTEPILRMHTGALYHAAIVETEIKGNKPRSRTRPLTFAEIDALHMDAWLRYGNKQTFFVRSPTKQYNTGPPIGERKRMRDYNWGTGAPGLKFGND